MRDVAESLRPTPTLEDDRAPETPMPGEMTIRSSRGWRFIDLRELWNFRELIYFLTLRDVKVRYKQTAIGVAWAVLQPLSMMIVFTLFFSRLANIPSDGVPYPIFVFTALIPWQLFSRAIVESSNSLVTDQKLITRVYFPRMIVPISTILAALVDLVIASVLLVLLMTAYGIAPGMTILWLPLFVALMLTTALGVGLWLSALNIEFRDVAYVVPFLNQMWLFVTPVVYPTSFVPEGWQLIYGINPMVSVVEGFRWALLGTGNGPSPVILLSGLVSLILFVTGALWFRHRERTFVDAVGSGGR